MTDTKGLQNEDKYYIRIKNLKEDPNSKFLNRNRYCYENQLLCYKTMDVGKESKATVPKSLIPTILKEMHSRFGNFTIGKTYSFIEIYYFWSHILKYISQ